MNKRYPVKWFQGLPVGPEVFQQSFLYTEYNNKFLLSNSSPYSWGVISISIDDSELTNGILKIKKLVAITNDYTLINIDEEDNLQIDLSLFKEELKNQALFLYISIPNNEYTEQSNVNNPKYSEIIKEVYDLNNKEDKIEIKFLKYNYFLEVAKTSSLQNTSLAIGKVIYNGMTYKFVDYCPPTCKINNCKILLSMLNSLISTMKDKINFLKMTKKTLENYILLSNVSMMLFSIEKCIKCSTHPYDLYSNLVLCSSYAFIFAKNNELPNIPEYQHNNILDITKELISYIDENIKAITVTCIQKPFEKQSTSTMTLFSINYPTKIKNDTILLGIERNKAAEYQDMQKWIEDAIISTVDQVTTTQNQRALGAKRKLIKNVSDLNLPTIENMMIIGIQIDNQFITEGQPICILNYDEKTPAPEAIYLIEN